ncbi:MAG TPA: hypothetical protein VKZ18_09620 [Polyangia bacterium]|nr:hypothetical protein [Polyangia bacterium]
MVLRRSACRHTWLSLLVLAAGCNVNGSDGGYPELSGALVGESAHFRLFVDPAFDSSTLPGYLQGQGGLDALETDWADKQSMLKMPEGKSKIDYHLMTGEQVLAACDQQGESCELGSTLQIATDVLPFQHELIHAYMELVAPGAAPVPFIREGTAQAIGCYGPVGVGVGVALAEDVPPWQQAVASDDYAYGQGGLFVRYLIRTQGIDAVVRYYAQAPGRRDPALFAANFAAFWNLSLDDAWAAMHVVAPGAASTDSPICPCSLPRPSTDGQPLPDDLTTHPYWPLPDTAGASLALTAPAGGALWFSDCEGVAPTFESATSTTQAIDPGAASLSDVMLAFVQPPTDGRRRYTGAPLTTVSVGQYIADSCGGAAPYQLPQDFVTGSGELSIIVDQSTIGGVAKYVQVQVPGTGLASLGPGLGYCSSCAFGDGECVDNDQSVPLVVDAVPGLFNVQWQVPAILPGGAFPDPAGASIQYFVSTE